MARLPQPGGDNGSWGNILNDYLSTSLTSDGLLKPGVVGDDQVSTLSQAKISGLSAALAAKVQLGGDLGGSVTVPLLKNVAKVFNVYDYGALGDGTTDDTASIQAALTAAATAGGGTVFIPAATFMVNPATGLAVGNNIILAGAGRGSALKVPNGLNSTGNLVRIENKTNVMVSNLLFDGNRAAQASGTNYGLYIAASNNCKIQNIWTENFTGVGSHVYDCDGVIVSGCTSTGNFYHGFECEQTRGCTWQGNRGSSNGRHGIFVSPGEVGGSGAKGNMIVGNSFDNNGQYGVAVGIAAAPGSELLSWGNMIIGNYVRSNAEYGVSLYYQDGSVISNNVIELNGFFGLYGYKTRGNTITNNNFHNNSQAGNNAYDEILLEGNSDGRAAKDNIVDSNVIIIDGAIATPKQNLPKTSIGTGVRRRSR